MDVIFGRRRVFLIYVVHPYPHYTCRITWYYSKHAPCCAAAEAAGHSSVEKCRLVHSPPPLSIHTESESAGSAFFLKQCFQGSFFFSGNSERRRRRRRWKRTFSVHDDRIICAMTWEFSHAFFTIAASFHVLLRRCRHKLRMYYIYRYCVHTYRKHDN